MSVRTVNVAKQAMPVVIDAVGTVESEHSVAVRPQVNGVLTAARVHTACSSWETGEQWFATQRMN